jgi:DNA-binding NtrC family response regulator
MANILVLDDDRSLCKMTCKLLERAGHLSHSFEFSRDALERIARGGIDVVLTDLMMPEVNGAEFVASLREIEPDLPVIVMSGGGLEADKLLKTIACRGSVETIFKPFKASHLNLLVNRMQGNPG